MSLSFSGGANDIISGAFFKNNGATQIGPRWTRKIGSGGDVGHICHVVEGNLALNDTIEIWVQNESSTGNITVEDGSFDIVRID
jgi:hypothetical protein